MISINEIITDIVIPKLSQNIKLKGSIYKLYMLYGADNFYNILYFLIDNTDIYTIENFRSIVKDTIRAKKEFKIDTFPLSRIRLKEFVARWTNKLGFENIGKLRIKFLKELDPFKNIYTQMKHDPIITFSRVCLYSGEDEYELLLLSKVLASLRRNPEQKEAIKNHFDFKLLINKFEELRAKNNIGVLENLIDNYDRLFRES